MRETLPNRRASIAEDIIWEGSIVTLHCSLNDKGEPKEIFIRPQGKLGKTGTAFQELATHMAILMSNLLRNGTTIEQLAGMFGRLDSGAPASIAGAAVDWLHGVERETGKTRLFDEA